MYGSICVSIYRSNYVYVYIVTHIYVYLYIVYGFIYFLYIVLVDSSVLVVRKMMLMFNSFMTEAVFI